ncbi:arginine--tRNA ligase [Solimicrobium silvestre]|uniref:Arginine--tRNA ligase n=1 Tax=Solimicrobium silvestre TaxID=2099400 RepID=A0A2S9GSF0_9BURK|nr:arginine--tRNA ligase [Solimicrobium silvestre]PRC90625.1 argS: arginine--tRNA ligase [Solimicrobium silvestre]
MLAQQKQHLITLINTAIAPLLVGSDLTPTPTLERPRDVAHGDIACNIAMQIAKPLKKNPRELAQAIVANLMAQPDDVLASAEIAGPGFINIRVKDSAKQAVIKQILQQAENFGKSTRGANAPVVVEFVSANPTGPLHVGHGRQAALGDSISALMTAQGFAVTREYYYNDAGVQIENLALSVQARARAFQPGQAGWPESAYNGDYIAEIAADFLAKKTITGSDGAATVISATASGDVNDIDSIRHFSVCYLRREQEMDLQAFGVKFDHYFLESSLYTDGKVAAAVSALQNSGKTYEQDGALWLRSTDYGDDKDRVMKKSDGTYTYFVPDVAYHITKWQRGFKKAVNIQGSDHHGTIARVRGGLQAVAMDIPVGYPDYVLHKMVTVMKDGAEVKLSKRAGSYVTLRDLIEWSGNGDIQIGRDAVRFFLISRKADTEFVFDVDVALARSDENPVYYVQYAHARICSVLEKVGEELVSAVLADSQTIDLAPLTAPREASLLAKLAEYPESLERALDELGPHQVAFYLRELAGEMHSYYNAERVLVEDTALKMARVALLLATKQVLQNGLRLIGVTAPVKM